MLHDNLRTNAVSDFVITKGYMRCRSMLALGFLVLFALLSVAGAVTARKIERSKVINLAAIDMALVSLSELSVAFGVLTQRPTSQQSFVAQSNIRRASERATDALRIIDAAVENEEFCENNLETLTQVALNPISDFKQILQFGRILNERQNNSDDQSTVKISSLSLEIVNRLMGVFSSIRQQETQNSQSARQQVLLYTICSILLFCVGILLSVWFVYLPMEKSVLAAHRQLLGERDRAEHASKAKTVFLASISHEIRTPLNSIIGLTETLSGSNLTPEQSETINLVNKSGHGLLQLLNNILSTSRGEALGNDEEESIFQPREICHEVIAMFDATARQRGNEVLFEYDHASSPIWIQARVGQFRQVLNNLLSNAIKFTQNGTISLSLSETQFGKQMRVELAVADTGIGIAPNKMEAVFEEFQQAQDDLPADYEGTGLGLSISRNIARSMRGDILCESELGIGTTFTFFFQADAAEPQIATVTKLPTDKIRNLKVIIVDDNKVNILVAERILKKLGIPANSTSSPFEALSMIRELQPQVVLMDVRMPEMSGLDATRRIKEMEAKGLISSVHVIGVSANDSLSDVKEALAAGMFSYVSKPVNAAKMAEALNKVVEETKNPDANSVCAVEKST